MPSIAVLAGSIGGLVGWGQADQVAGLIVGLMVIGAGAKTLLSVLHELTEGGLRKDEVKRIREAIESVDGARGWHHLRTRRVGREIFVELHVLVEPSLSVVNGHDIASGVEDAIHRACSTPVTAMVHVEPDVARDKRHPNRKSPESNEPPRE
jgi:cation diffusion facilitator family transporter